MVLGAVNITYVFPLHNVFTGYMGSLMKYIMKRLMVRYGRITAADIKMNNKYLQKALDMSQPIDVAPPTYSPLMRLSGFLQRYRCQLVF